VEVLLVIEPVAMPLDRWPDGFFEGTFGAFSEQPLDRPAQGRLDAREALH
jgi:hypothetical protein